MANNLFDSIDRYYEAVVNVQMCLPSLSRTGETVYIPCACVRCGYVAAMILSCSTVNGCMIEYQELVDQIFTREV